MRAIINFFKRLFGLKISVEQVPSTTNPVPSEPTDHPPEQVGSDEAEIRIGQITNATEKEYNMILTAIVHVRDIVYSKYFAEEVLKSTFTSTGGKTNQEILDLFTKTIIVINVEMFYGSFMQNKIWKTQGYEQGDGIVYANRYFIKDSLSMGSLILHECAHIASFHHESSSEYTSVPYRMNKIFNTVAAKLNLKA